MSEQDVSKKNTKLAKKLLLVAVAMFGFGYALVPLYDVLCKWKWIERDRPDDIKKVPEVAYKVDMSREITIEFMTTLNESTPMEVRSEKKQLKVHPGEYYTVNYYAENKTDKVMVARAIASFSPAVISSFFEKIQCFCFDEQTFKPREAKVMPMRFTINPELPEQYKTITLSYTFFDITEKSVKK
ncbi:MAG: cytochrome c oxidase assembly protein [Methylococcales bacterium]|nr:cytochrome c oxidase assembly protein [Methylococcales bacterium]